MAQNDEGKAKSQNNSMPDSISEAIAKLEGVGQSAAQDLRSRLEKDFSEVQSALDQLKPVLADLKKGADEKVQSAQADVENRIKQNPWAVIALIGALAFFIGWILGKKKN